MTLIRASALPVVVSAAGSVTWSVSVGAMGATASGGRLAAYLLFALLGLAVSFLGILAQLIVMGGASRNLVMHLLWGEPVTARLIYRSVRSRFWSLLGASLLVALWLIISAVAAACVLGLAMLLIFIVLAAAVAVTASAGMQWVTIILSILLCLAGLIVTLYVFFLLAGRVAYVPQVLMVEGRGAIEAVGRSVQLARGNVRRLMGMFLFTTFAGYSALMLLLVPLLWLGYLNGVDLNPFTLDPSRVPAWYTVSREVIAQLSTILLAPVWVMGLSLLYVDERVRHEGYDIELLAAQRLGAMPEVPAGLNAPLTPAIAAPVLKDSKGLKNSRAERGRPGSVLGL